MQPLVRNNDVGAGAPPEARHIWARPIRDHQTTERVVAAIVELAFVGDTQPSQMRIAERAGLSPRIVRQELIDEERLRDAVRVVELELHSTELSRIDTAASFEDRLAAFVDQRVRLFESLGIARSAELLPRAETFQRESAASRRILREHAAATFAPELAKLARNGQEACDILDALDTTTSWETWNHLRMVVGRRPSRAARALEMSVSRLLQEPSVTA